MTGGPRALQHLALRVERAEAEQLARTGPPGRDGAREVAGGLAVLKAPGSPYNAALGVGLAGPVRDGELDALEAHLGQGGGAVRIEVAAPADPSLAAGLARRGYRLERFHQVWTRAPLPPPAARDDVEVRPIRPGEEAAWIETFSRAFFGRPPASAAAAGALLAITSAEGNVCFGAFDGGVLVAVALASAHGRVATLSGAGVPQARRGAGLQLALVRARLAWAAARGCDVAASATDPATASQRTLEKAGFRCAYPKAVLVREAPRA